MWLQYKNLMNILFLMLVVFKLSTDFTDAKKVRWVMGNDRILIDKINQKYKSTTTETKIQSEKIITNVIKHQHKYSKITHSVGSIAVNRIMQHEKRMKMNRILQNDRKRQHQLRMKMDRMLLNPIMPNNQRMQYLRNRQNGKITQNERKQPNGKRIQHVRNNTQNERRRLNARRMQNDRKIINEKKAQNDKRILKAYNQKIMNARRIRDDKRMWVATPARIVLREANEETNTNSESDSSDRNITEYTPNEDDNSTQSTEAGSGSFWHSLNLIFQGLTALEAPGTQNNKVRVCYIIASTYMAALKDLRRFLSLRYFYENNLHFEVGYMVNEIITKYQRMLEIYYIAEVNWFKHQGREFISNIYMLYLYTNVLEMGTAIGHLCHMITELEERFMTVTKKTGFVDYQLAKKPKNVLNSTAEIEKAVAEYEKRLAAERKRKERERRKARKKNLFAGYKPTTPDRRPKGKGSWPLIYGWSIEYFW